MTDSSNNKTSVDVNSVNSIADRIGSIAEDMSPFDNLAGLDPTPGTFDAANWLHAIVTDRRDAIVQHGRDLEKLFGDMQTHLRNVAQDYQNADTSNAAGVRKLNNQLAGDVNDMKSQVRSDAPGLFASSSASSSTNYDTGDNKDSGAATQTVTFDSNGSGSTVTQSDGKTQHVDGGEPA